MRLRETVSFTNQSEDPNYKFEVITDGNGAVEVRNAAVLQEHSKNGYRYSMKAREDALSLYEGTSVYFNHGNSGDYLAQFASMRPSGIDAQGIVRSHVVPNMGHPHTKQFVWDAEHNPSACALSHEVPEHGFEATADSAGNIESIERIFEVDCVAVVVNGGVNKSLKEHDMSGEQTKELQEQINAAVESALREQPQPTAESFKPLLESAVTKVLEQCACENNLQVSLDEMTAERDALQAKVTELEGKVAKFEEDAATRERKDQLESEAQEHEVQLTAELTERLMKLDPDDATFFLKQQAGGKKKVEESGPEPTATPGATGEDAPTYTGSILEELCGDMKIA
jgi:hypothetical protein